MNKKELKQELKEAGVTDYNKIKEIILKKGIQIYYKRITNYYKSKYAVTLKNDIYVHSHIDLEVATTHFKFNVDGELIDIITYGWY